MDDDTERSAFEQIVEILVAEQVEFLVIGGQAEQLHGSARVTYDTDLCYRRTAENLERLARALRQLKPTLHAARPTRLATPAQMLHLSTAQLSWFRFTRPLSPWRDAMRLEVPGCRSAYALPKMARERRESQACNPSGRVRSVG